MLALTQQQKWTGQTHLLLWVSLRRDRRWKQQRKHVETPRRQRPLRPLVFFARVPTTNRQNRDIRQHDTLALATPFATTSGPLLMRGQNGMLSIPVVDTGAVMRRPYVRNRQAWGRSDMSAASAHCWDLCSHRLNASPSRMPNANANHPALRTSHLGDVAWPRTLAHLLFTRQFYKFPEASG